MFYLFADLTESVGAFAIDIINGILRVLSVPFVLLYRFLKFVFGIIFKTSVYFFCPAEIGRHRYLSLVKSALSNLKNTLRSNPKMFFTLLLYYVKKNNSLYRFRIRYLIYWVLPLTCAIVFAVVIHNYSDRTIALKVSQNGETIGYVLSEDELLHAADEANELLSFSGTGSYDNRGLNYTFSFTEPENITSVGTVRDRIVKNSSVQTEYACGVYIDGTLFSVCKSAAFAKECFDSILDNKSVDADAYLTCFTQDISYSEGIYPSDAVLCNSDFAQLLEEKADTLLSLKVLKTEIENIPVEYDTVEVPSNMLYVGTKKKLSSGKEGLAQVTNLVTYIGSSVVETTEISRIVLKESVAERIQTGTKALDSAYSSVTMGGIFLWPIVGAYGVNSDYGYRWGRLHAGIDLGMGGGAGTSLGKDVVAVASGVVTAATYHSAYGYYITIDHGNGLSTLYAHLYANSFTISAGDTVSAGQPIAKVGSTGNSTGPHLHFEVRINGSKVDPKPYLGI